MDNLVNGLSISFIGIVIVMSVLALLSLIVSLFKHINKPEITAREELTEASAEGTHEELDDDDIPQEVIAAISAAICAAEGSGPDKLIIRSVKRGGGWNAAARREQQKRLF